MKNRPNLFTPPYYRPRRNRKSSAIRALVTETQLSSSDLIYPQFVVKGSNIKDPIQSMPGIYRLSLDVLLKEIESLIEWGIPAIALFPVIESELKNREGSEAINPRGILQQAIFSVKKHFPQLCVMTDIALDPYTSHGQDGLVDENGEILNDPTLGILKQMALIQAEAGADMVAPSDMMDGRVGVIRAALNENDFASVNIHAYTAKYASAFYSPFRDAIGLKFPVKDKKTYQMNPANSREALLEAFLDEWEGADILMIKPAILYLDVISKIRASTALPISAYHVSGEYAMIMAAAQNGWLDEDQALLESILSIKRAGADMILTYGAIKVARLLANGALY